jgi:high-affinity nickel-transport protein
MSSLLSALLLGLFLGVRHATDADHVVAVTTLVARRQGARAALSLGALWGLGHAFTLFVVGGAIILLGVVVPPRIGLLLELGVALMLIGLGAMNLVATPATSHADGAHDDQAHGQRHHRHGLRSLGIGVVHGLAGSAAVALLVLSTIHHAGWALVYLLCFGGGTILGMVGLTTAMSVPLAAAARRFGSIERRIGHLTGALSVALGIFLVYQIGFVDGLFGAEPSWSPH